MVPVFNDTHASAMNAVAPPYRKERLSTCRTKVKYWSGRNGMVAQSENSIHCTAVMKRERAMACSCRSRSVSPVNTHHTHFEDISQVTHKFPFTKYWHWAIYSELRFLFGHWREFYVELIHFYGLWSDCTIQAFHCLCSWRETLPVVMLQAFTAFTNIWR